MTELGCRFFLGTDNVMVVQPDMFAELAFTGYIYKLQPSLLIRAAISGSTLLDHDFSIRKGAPATFFILDPGRTNMRYSRDPVATIIKRASSMDIVKKVFISQK